MNCTLKSARSLKQPMLATCTSKLSATIQAHRIVDWTEGTAGYGVVYESIA